MHANRSVDVHRFSMVPRADIPRSAFKIQSSHKTAFDAGYLIPVYVDEVLPGDSIALRMTAFARLSTPLFPIMDNMHLDSFFFFVPNRLVWSNWQKFMGEQENPGDSTDFSIPQCVSPAAGYAVGSIFDYMGLPTVGQVTAGQTVSHSAMWLRAYNLIWNEWFRDQNLQDSVVVNKGDGPDPVAAYSLLRRGKRHDYFTSCLPWPQKGPSVPLALGGSAPVKVDYAGGGYPRITDMTNTSYLSGTLSAAVSEGRLNVGGTNALIDPHGSLYADLGAATAATINQLRQSFQIQKLLERDARGGTRYTELIRAHFGVLSPDARLQRPEYLGGGQVPIVINPVAQVSATGQSGSTTPLGTLGAVGTSLASGHGFSQSFTEHGMIIGLVSVRADLNYQQGLRKMWSRKTRFDYYFPAFAHLGEQTVLQKEIFCTGTQAEDEKVFGYQERWAEYRYMPSLITSVMRSTSEGTLDAWHLAQKFLTAPTLSPAFIEERPPVDRVLATSSQIGKQLIADMFFDVRSARPMPAYSVPGLIDHF